MYIYIYRLCGIDQTACIIHHWVILIKGGGEDFYNAEGG